MNFTSSATPASVEILTSPNRRSPFSTPWTSISGALAPEALDAWEAMADDLPGWGLLNVTSPDLLHRGWSASENDGSHVDALLAPLADDARLVTLIDGSPAALSWLGGVRGHRVRPLGVERFGQTGSLPALYAHHGLDADAVIDAVARVLI